MKVLTKNNSRKEIELAVFDLIMQQEYEFEFKTIMNQLCSICDEDIDKEELADIVVNAIEFCLNDGYIDIYDQLAYMVDPVKQIEYAESHVESVEV